MKLYRPIICTCHCCGCKLSYRPHYDNIWNGGPWYCGNCGANVTEDIYGKKKEKAGTTKNSYMNQITIDKNILLVEVPEKLQGFYILPTANNDNNGLLHRDFTGAIAIVPPGNWQFIGTTDDVTEEMAAKIVHSERIKEIDKLYSKIYYKNYVPKNLKYWCATALESYQSWLRAKKIPSNKRFAILKQSI